MTHVISGPSGFMCCVLIMFICGVPIPIVDMLFIDWSSTHDLFSELVVMSTYFGMRLLTSCVSVTSWQLCFQHYFYSLLRVPIVLRVFTFCC
jgi:hypothetical protein